MPRKKKETLVHFDIDTLSKKTEQKPTTQPTSLGKTLQAKREKKKLSLEDVSRKLCIKETYLSALENGHYYAFPSRVYGIGFLRTYAKFLGLDADLMVAEFHAETSDIKDAPLDMPVIEKHFALPSKRTLGFVALALLIIIIVWFTVAAIITSDVFKKIEQPNPETSATETTIEQTAEIVEITDESLLKEKEKEESIPKTEKKLNPKVFTASVAFVATEEVWVRLYNSETKKVILDKIMQKNDSFIPESKLAVLELTTGRPNFFDLYKNGKKIKTFGQEKNMSLSEFSDEKN